MYCKYACFHLQLLTYQVQHAIAPFGAPCALENVISWPLFSRWCVASLDNSAEVVSWKKYCHDVIKIALQIFNMKTQTIAARIKKLKFSAKSLSPKPKNALFFSVSLSIAIPKPYVPHVVHL